MVICELSPLLKWHLCAWLVTTEESYLITLAKPLQAHQLYTTSGHSALTVRFGQSLGTAWILGYLHISKVNAPAPQKMAVGEETCKVQREGHRG